MPPNTLKDKVVWITGGGSGIGLAGGIELAKAGAHVVISGRSRETLSAGEKQIRAVGSGESIALDVGQQAEVSRFLPADRRGSREVGASPCHRVRVRAVQRGAGAIEARHEGRTARREAPSHDGGRA